MALLSDRYELNQDNFERCISHGMKMSALPVLFRCSVKELDDFCIKEYGTNFNTVYEILKQMAIERYADIVDNLSLRGNNTALNIMDRMLNDTTQDKTVRIVFDSKSIQEETEEDKANG